MKTTLGVLSLFVLVSLFTLNDSFAEVSPNSSFILEGSGFAVTENSINYSEVDLALSTQQKTGSSIKSTIEDGFVTINGEDFLATDLTLTILREGKYMRINGIAENIQGDEVSIRFFGRLVEESKNASVYGFTGRITTSDDTFKTIYTVKFSELTKIISTSEPIPEKQITIRINKGASSQGLYSNYIESGESTRLRYFSIDRIAVEPGTSITIVNDDVVSHRVVSGSGFGSNSKVLNGKICSEIEVNLPTGFYFIPEGSEGRDCDFIFDGRVNTGELQPGSSTTITFKDQGFYRLIDPDYPWMRIDGYVFSNINNLVLGQGQNLGN